MSDDNSKQSGRTWSAISAVALLISIALGLLLFWYTGDILDALWGILIVFGIYMAVASAFRAKDADGFGPSPADAAAAGGIMVLGVGLAGLSYSLMGEVIISVVVIIVFLAITGLYMAIKNRGI